MKRTIENPTSFFFTQATNPTLEYRPQIDLLVSTLLDLKKCVLCKQDYTLMTRVPRILIHCGHTFCTPCLKNFYRNMRIRCPLCLKLVKNIEFLERLPVNHTIFTKLAEDHNNKNRLEGNQEVIDSQQALYQQFAAAQNLKGLPEDEKFDMIQGDPSANPAAKLGTIKPNNYMNTEGGNKEVGGGEEEVECEPCDLHPDRLMHFYCVTDRISMCRVCAEAEHGKDRCIVVDLYDVGDVKELFKDNEIDDKEKDEALLQQEDDENEKYVLADDDDDYEDEDANYENQDDDDDSAKSV